MARKKKKSPAEEMLELALARGSFLASVEADQLGRLEAMVKRIEGTEGPDTRVPILAAVVGLLIRTIRSKSK